MIAERAQRSAKLANFSSELARNRREKAMKFLSDPHELGQGPKDLVVLSLVELSQATAPKPVIYAPVARSMWSRARCAHAVSRASI